MQRTLGEVEEAAKSYEYGSARAASVPRALPFCRPRLPPGICCPSAMMPLIHLIGTRKFAPETDAPLQQLEAYVDMADELGMSARPAFDESEIEKSESRRRRS